MSAVLNVPVIIAYHLVSALALGLTGPLGGAAAAAAIIVFTIVVRLLLMPLTYYAMRGQNAQARLAPHIAELRKRHAGQPERMQREIIALYRKEGTGILSGCLPLLVQAPFLSVMYLLFRSPVIGRSANRLLSHHVFGAVLGSHWLAGAGPLSGQGIVFFAIFALLAVIGWLNVRLARRFPPVGVTAPAAAAGAGGAGHPGGPAGRLAKVLPYLSVAAAAFVPLAAGLCLVTSAAWTLTERVVLHRRLLCT